MAVVPASDSHPTATDAPLVAYRPVAALTVGAAAEAPLVEEQVSRLEHPTGTANVGVALPVAYCLRRLSAALVLRPPSLLSAQFLRGSLAYLPQTPAEFGLRERRLLSLLMEQMRLILLFLSGMGVPGSHVCLLALAGFVAAAGVELASAAKYPRVWNFTGIPLDPVPDSGSPDLGDASSLASGEPPIVSALALPPSSPEHPEAESSGPPLVQVQTDGPLDLSGLASQVQPKPHAL